MARKISANEATAWRRQQLLLRIGLAAFMIALAVLSLVAAKRGDWKSVYLPAGLRLRAGQDIFQAGYVYPPFQASVAAIFTYLPANTGRVAWALLNAAAGGIFLLGAWRLSGGEFLKINERVSRTELGIAAIGVASAIGFLFDAISNGQTDLIVAALLTSGWLCARRGGFFGPALMGVGAAAKCTPLLFVPWVAWRRDWLAGLSILITAVAVNLLPDLFFPTANGEPRLVTWAHNYLLMILGENYSTGTWFTALEFNHSLSGFCRRLLPAEMVRPIWVGASAAVFVLAALTLLRVRAAEKSIVAKVEGFEFGMVFCLMLVLSPASSKPHFCVLLLPAWAVAREAVTRRDRLLFGVVMLAMVGGLVANKDLVGATVYDAAKWWGVITLEAVLLLGGCVWAHWRAVNRIRRAE